MEANRAGAAAETSGGFDRDVCPHCGSSKNRGGIEALLGQLGISSEMLENLDIDQLVNSARDYLKDGGTKAKNFAKENPGKIAAGAAVLAIGAGLLMSRLRNRE
ncbi:MAG TPA: hypothetical protein VNL91_05910 [Thermoanaerobaculia bacterium]|nr:hypothetical protein [Thermoanaerobaculia bacterium]